MTAETVGAVLAGGRGRRLGGDKGSREIAGQTLVRRAVDALREAGLDVALVLSAHQPVPLTAHTLAVLRDEVENAGPLGGLHALLRWLPVEWALVMACDQPFVLPDLLRGLLAQPRDDIDVIIGQPTDLTEPLPGLYRRTCLPAIEEALARDERSLQKLLSSLRVHTVPEKALRRWDRELLSYLNVNTPADRARARDIGASAGLERSQCEELLGQRR